jgi:hypothetical protein
VKNSLLPTILLLSACATTAGPVVAPLPAQEDLAPAPALSVAPLAGQRIPVLPVSYLLAESPIDSFLVADRTARLRWADSLIGEVLQARGPEVEWVLPPALRQIARRAPATVTDPDRMGQSIMRAEKLETVPDPLRGYLRSLTAMANARLVFIPAAVRFSPDPATGGVRVEADLVLADSRNGVVVWRSTPVAVATTAAGALEAVISHILPDFD